LPFFTATAEDKGVSTLEAYDRLAGRCMLDEDLVDALLRGVGAAWDLGDLDDLRLRPCMLQRCQGGEPITNDHVSLRDRLQSGDSQ
jgi:hypothetical protein